MEKTKKRERSDPYYDLIEDFELIQASFQSQYGIRLSRDLKEMKWKEFRALMIGLAPETPLGRMISIRSETDKDVLKNFTSAQKRINSEWQKRIAKNKKETDTKMFLDVMKNAFIAMAGGISN